MCFKLKDKEKQDIRKAMKVMLSGAFVQDKADFITYLLGSYVIGLVENRNIVFPEREQNDQSKT